MVKKLLFVTCLLSVSLFACTPNPSIEIENEPSSPWLASTSRCPEAPIYPTPSNGRKEVYILLDNSGSYESYYGDASQLLKEVLVQALWPGDFVGIGLIGQEAANAIIPNTLFQQLEEPSPPNYKPTLTPLPNNAIGSDLQQHEIENGFILRENEDWNNVYDISTSQRENLPIFQMIGNAIPTRSQAEGSTDIQSALFNAHDFFSQARKQGYTDLKLIIFSDLAETEPPQEWFETIDLSDVSVIVAMTPFENVSFFKESEAEWAGWFEVYQVVNFELLTIPNSTVSTLVSYLEN